MSYLKVGSRLWVSYSVDLSTDTLESSTLVSRSIRLVLSYPFYHSFYEARGGLGCLYFFFLLSTSSLPGWFILGVSFLPCGTVNPYNVLHPLHGCYEENHFRTRWVVFNKVIRFVDDCGAAISYSKSPKSPSLNAKNAHRVVFKFYS